MSTIRANNILDSSGGNTAQINGMTPTALSLQGFRNRIINGAMVIDQRNAGASLTWSGANYLYPVDRFGVGLFGSTYSNPAMTGQQVTDAPAGFTNSIKVTSSSTITPDANKLGSWFEQRVEGFNIADLAWGTASAVSVTISFRIKASKTGTVSVSIENSANDRSYLTTVTVSAANTWETKSVTIPGDTTGTWLTNNGMGLSLKIGIMGNGSWLAGTGGSWSSTRVLLSSSQTNFIASSGDNIAITGVQLEAGSVATPFERMAYGLELALCQRYCFVSATTNGYQSGCLASTTAAEYTIRFPVTMRAAPSFSALGLTGYGPAAGNYSVYVYNTGTNAGTPGTPSLTTNITSTDQANLIAAISSGTAGYAANIDLRTGLKLSFSAEL